MLALWEERWPQQRGCELTVERAVRRGGQALGPWVEGVLAQGVSFTQCQCLSRETALGAQV